MNDRVCYGLFLLKGKAFFYCKMNFYCKQKNNAPLPLGW